MFDAQGLGEMEPVLSGIARQDRGAANAVEHIGNVRPRFVGVGSGGLEVARELVIVIPNATHYIFLSREEEVISQISDFVNSLPAKH